MIIEHTAFIIPLHPPKYHYIYNFISTLIKNDIQIDVYIVFSNDEDFRRFTLKEYIKPIIITESFHTKSIITFKKFYGLKYLMNTAYDYFIVCDSEIDILPENFTPDTIKNKLDAIYFNKNIYAGDITNIDTISHNFINSISEHCARLFSDDEYKHLQSLSNNFNLYSWWSDIPVYKRVHLKDFFNKIDYSNIDCTHFDHIIYQYYLILTEGFRLINTTPITNIQWSLEQNFTTDRDILVKLVELGYGFGWVAKNMHTPSNYEFLMTQKALLLYHLDR